MIVRRLSNKTERVATTLPRGALRYHNVSLKWPRNCRATFTVPPFMPSSKEAFDARTTGRKLDMLATPRFFDTPSQARSAAKKALVDCRVVCPVNDILVRVDPDEGRWFGIIILDTDSLPTLVSARRQLPGFRVIGEALPKTREEETRSAGERPRRLAA